MMKTTKAQAVERIQRALEADTSTDVNDPIFRRIHKMAPEHEDCY